MKMITTRCGLSCEGCSYKEDCGCGECIKSNGNPFHGPCRLAQCCQDKGHVHCGECKEFPCELLKEYSYDQEQGDQGERIEVCRQWSSRRQDASYPWIHEYLSEKPGTEMDFKVEWQWTRYKIGNKMFAAVCKDDSGNDYIISLKLEPSEGEFLRSQYEEIIPGYYMNKLHWNSVDLYGKVPENLLKDMIDKSYDLMLNSLSKKMQREILGKEN